jgi:hypothetical protein
LFGFTIHETTTLTKIVILPVGRSSIVLELAIPDPESVALRTPLLLVKNGL